MERKPSRVWNKTDMTLEMPGLLTVARSMIAARKAITLPRELIHDPALDILLNLFVADAEGRIYRDDDIASVTTVHASGVVRWVNVLIEYRLLERQEGFIDITDAGRDAVRTMLRSVAKSQWQFTEV